MCLFPATLKDKYLNFEKGPNQISKFSTYDQYVKWGLFFLYNSKLLFKREYNVM